MRALTPIAAVVLLLGCQVPEPKPSFAPGTVIGHPDSLYWRAKLPLDSADLLKMLALADSSSTGRHAIGESSIMWQERLDFITVRNMMPACTCPDFAVEDSARFGVKDVYLIPANESARIPERMNVAQNRFLLIGQRSSDTLRPPQTMGPPWPGYFFRYLSYKVIRPYRVWGPRVFDASADTTAGEEPWLPSLLTVR